ncbi:MAG TPA: GvpL/GvpF family gas vesicle protein [Solirubrobacteraceae bacterium]|nr:GvpL/GvpF family gas vesicle protein [Solirubrobacteraceae bacterium]
MSAPDLLWAYCVLRAGDAGPTDARGIGGEVVARVEQGGLAALVSRVPATEFAHAPLTRNLDDLDWLAQVARAHEAVLDDALARGTIVPLRMCTIFESEQRVSEMLERQGARLAGALDALDGRVEWAVKVLVDPEQLVRAAGPRPEASRAAAGASARGAGAGGAYLRRRRDERAAREAAGGLAADVARRIHARLRDWALDARTRPPQNRALSGHEGEMVLNAAYLVERERTEELRGIVGELGERHRELGARIELTGPWPPYNFVPGGRAASAA